MFCILNDIHTYTSAGRSEDVGSFTFAVTRDDLNLVNLSEFVDFPEFNVVQHQCPDVVAESIGIQLGRLEGYASLHLCVESRINGLVELQQHLESQLWCDLTVLKILKSHN